MDHLWYTFRCCRITLQHLRAEGYYWFKGVDGIEDRSPPQYSCCLIWFNTFKALCVLLIPFATNSTRGSKTWSNLILPLPSVASRLAPALVPHPYPAPLQGDAALTPLQFDCATTALDSDGLRQGQVQRFSGWWISEGSCRTKVFVFSIDWLYERLGKCNQPGYVTPLPLLSNGRTSTK